MPSPLPKAFKRVKRRRFTPLSQRVVGSSPTRLIRYVPIERMRDLINQ